MNPRQERRAKLHPTGIEAYRPAEIARRIEDAGVDKAGLPLLSLCTLGMLAGFFIALGAMFYLSVLAGADAGYGPVRLAAGVAFSLGLILVIVGGAELFTGNALIVMAWVDGLVTLSALLRNWGIVYVANLAGAGLAVILAVGAGLHEEPIGRVAIAAAAKKVALSNVELFARGILCNALVCLAVWLSFAARDIAGKLCAIIVPIAAFVALGFEHSIANMFLLPFVKVAGATLALSDILRNLAWVTLGNVIGGGGGVAMTYWAAYRTKTNQVDPEL